MTPAVTYVAVGFGLMLLAGIVGHVGSIADSLKRLAEHAENQDLALAAELERLDRAAQERER